MDSLSITLFLTPKYFIGFDEIFPKYTKVPGNFFEIKWTLKIVSSNLGYWTHCLNLNQSL